MISDRIHKSWVTKVVKQTSFLQKKYNSNDCKKFGNPNQDDVADVWAEFGGNKELIIENMNIKTENGGTPSISRNF